MSTALHALTWFGNLIPQAENPLPDRIGLSFPFTLAGAGGMLSDFVRPSASAAERDRLARILGFWCFWLGVLIYGIAAYYQLLSER